MEGIGNIVYTEEFEAHDEANMHDKFYMEASLTYPLNACKYKIIITFYYVDAARTSFCYHHEDQVHVWSNDGFCSRVDKNCVFLLHNGDFQVIDVIGMQVPTIDPGNSILSKCAGDEPLVVGNVDTIAVNKDNNDNSDKDLNRDSFEKMKKKTSNVYCRRGTKRRTSNSKTD